MRAADLLARGLACGLSVLVCLLIGLGGEPAYADEDPRETARREFAAGQAADRRKDWPAAIEHYMRANDQVPHPFAIYNIAVNYERLDKLREAVTWYERYAASVTDATERERVQRTLTELLTRPAPFTVTSIPERARVFVDGVPVGVTPYRGTLKGGFHRITVELDGRRDRRDVTVEYAEPVKLELTLPAATGVVRVTGAPPGAEIHVDDQAAGTLPARLTLPAGLHTIRVTSPGYAPYETPVNVDPGREIGVHAPLVRGGAPGANPGANPDPGAATGKRVIRAGYLVGFAGGADARTGGVLGLVEVGVRVGPLDGSARIGSAAGLTSIDLLLRWTLTSGRIAPFIGAGYTAVKDGGGYALSGGLRWDVARGDHAGVSLLAESGLRYYRSEVSEPGEAPVTNSGFIVPLMASVLVLYK